MLEQLGPAVPNPIDNWFTDQIAGRVVNQVIQNPALLYTMVLAGEEIPDLLQKRAAEHPGTDPFVREVNRYHRQEEARHGRPRAGQGADGVAGPVRRRPRRPPRRSLLAPPGPTPSPGFWTDFWPRRAVS